MTSPAEADAQARGSDDPFEQRPEVFVGAALAGGFLLALVLRKLGPDE